MSCVVKRALISVSDKSGILELAEKLSNLGVEIISTGGTFNYLQQNGISVKEVSSITNFPEILDGRVKTLHPLIHGAILGKKDNTNHLRQMQQNNITGIDLVCVNLYPFETTINKKDCTFDEAIENIDIGGPALIRASGKNHAHTIVLTDVKDYDKVINELETTNNISQITRLKLAQKAFAHTAYYDSLISQYLLSQINEENEECVFCEENTIPLKLVQNLRYGENSHQKAAFYKDSGVINGLLASFKQLQGKELSYNNLMDSDAAWECVKQFDECACVIVKHSNPCGVAVNENALSCYQMAYACDPISSFGSIIAFNRKVDGILAKALITNFLEVLIAPEFTDEALLILATKPNVRLLQINLLKTVSNKFDYKRIGGGLLIQTPENKILNIVDLKVVTQNKPTPTMYNDLLFAWNVARFVKSNAITLVKNKQLIGIGAGQMSRIDSTKIALSKAREFGFDVNGAVCASDAFFPFRDNVDLLAKNGIKAIIHPGGSIKDKEVFAAADEYGMIMVLTSFRAFRH